jgi:hypothetical protein
MNLHDRIACDLDRTDRPGPDIARVTAGARAQGRRLTLFRRATAAGGTLAVLAIGGTVLLTTPLGAGSPGTEASVASDPTPPLDPAPTSPPMAAGPETEPATGRAAVAALLASIEKVTDAPTTGYYGQDPLPEYDSADYYAQVELDDGEGAANVEINVQFDGGYDGGCLTTMDDCRSQQLPDGGTLTTYMVTGDKSLGDLRSIAELVRPDGVRVVVAATNSVTRPGAPIQITRSAPPLTPNQISGIARENYWNEELPSAFLVAGKELQPFRLATSVGENVEASEPD